MYIAISTLLLASLTIFYILVISPNEKSKKEMQNTQQETLLKKTEEVDPVKETVEQEPKDNEVVFCTQDVRKCPDGSFVGRVPPKCEFAPCKNADNLK